MEETKMIRLYLGMNYEQMEELKRHLYYNGYDVDWVSDCKLDVSEDEIDYVITILEDRGIQYERNDISTAEAKINKIKKLLAAKNRIEDDQEFGLSYGQAINYLEDIEEILKG